MIPSFQAVLLPILAVVAIPAAIRATWGITAFIAAFPLVNSLPYFFGIYEHVPHAPTGLVLFLFFFLGLWAGSAFRPAPPAVSGPLSRPITLAAGVILISALITAFRFTGFFPIRVDAIYELTLNVEGVTTGGGLMSSLFHALNYLTGFLLFIILARALRSGFPVFRLFTAFLAGLIPAVLAGIGQAVFNPRAGNTPFWADLGQINATFKDPNACAGVLSAAIPILLALLPVWKGFRRWAAAAAAAGMALLLPLTGNRSSFIGLGLALLLLAGIFLRRALTRRSGRPARLKSATAGLLALGLLAAVTAGYLGIKNSPFWQRSRLLGTVLSTRKGWLALSPERYFLWKKSTTAMADYPLTGLGTGAFIVELPNLYALDTDILPPNMENFRRIDSAENYFLQAGAELGLAGLIPLLWIFAILASRSVRAWARCSRGENRAIPAAAAGLGLAALGLGYLFHSYIGSFEVKYLFWMSAAVLLTGDSARGRLRWGRRLGPIATAAWLLLFGALFLGDSLQELSLPARTRALGLQHEFGFYAWEKDASGRPFRWTGKQAGQTLAHPEREVRIPIKVSHPGLEKRPVTVSVSLVRDLDFRRGRRITVPLSNGAWHDLRIDLEPGERRNLLLLFEVDRTWNPARVLGAADNRDLGIALRPMVSNGREQANREDGGSDE